MIDLHSHLLYGIDDGCLDIDESISLIKSAYNNGYKALILTPHYIEDTNYNSNVSNNNKILNILKSKCYELNIDIELYLGNEVYYSKDIINLLEKKEISTLNNTRYLLMEFSFVLEDKNILDTIDILVRNNIIPIIAHPERYPYLMKDINKLKQMIEYGALFQSNIGSLLGIYGNDVKNNIIKLLKNNMIHVLSSDVHHTDLYSKINMVKNILDRININYKDDLLSLNPNKILNNEEIKEPLLI